MKEFLLEMIFALVVFCVLYEVSDRPFDPGAAPPASETVQTAAFAEGTDLGVHISAAVFHSAEPVVDRDPQTPFPLPRMHRG